MLLEAMRVLVVGGTRFLGPPVVTRLSNLGHEVTVFHRGEHEPSLPFGVRHVHAPEAASPVVAFPPELTELAWDIVLSMMPVGERDARALVETFRGVTRRLVALSSGTARSPADSGFITPLSHNFCEACNRVRLTCTGTLHTCLGQEDAADLRAVIRGGADDAGLIEAIRNAVDAKPKGHDFHIARSLAPSVARHMSTTGG